MGVRRAAAFLIVFAILNLYVWVYVLTGVHNDHQLDSQFLVDVAVGGASALLGAIVGAIGVWLAWQLVQLALEERKNAMPPALRRTDNLMNSLGLVLIAVGLGIVITSVVLPTWVIAALTVLGVPPSVWSFVRQFWNPQLPAATGIG